MLTAPGRPPGARAPGARPSRRGSRDVGLSAVEFPSQVAGGGAARDPHHGELLGVARDGARVGTNARFLPHHGVCGPQRLGSGPPAWRVWGQGQAGPRCGEAHPLPRAGSAQSLYCWGLHTGALPGVRGGDGCGIPSTAPPSRAPPTPGPQLLTRHMHHPAPALPSHVAGLTGHTTPH